MFRNPINKTSIPLPKGRSIKVASFHHGRIYKKVDTQETNP